MLFSKTYNEIKLPGIGMYKSKGSKFISYAFPVYSTEEIKVKIKSAKEFWIAEEYHQDFAFRNNIKYNFYRYRCGRDLRLDELNK